MRKWRSVCAHPTTRRYIPGELNLQYHRCENLKSRTVKIPKEITRKETKSHSSGLQAVS
jgi:hypothetical protein